MTGTGRVRQLLALALATGTLVAAGSGTAGAAGATSKDVFSATGAGSVLHLELNLPQAVPGIGQSISQDLVLTGTSTRSSSFTDRASAITQAFLGRNGNVPGVSPALDGASTTAEFGKPQPAAVNMLPNNPLITGGVLSLSSTAHNPDTVGQVAHSVGSITDLKVAGGGNLQPVLDALNKQLTAVLDQVIGALPNGAPAAPVAGVPQVSGLVLSLIQNLNKQTKDQGKPVTDAVQPVIGQLNALPKLLAQQLQLKTTDASLLSIGLVRSEQTVTRTAGAVTSQVQNELGAVKLLGGLISVKSFTSDSASSLGQGVSSAKAHGSADVLKINVLNALTAQVTGPLKATLGGKVIPPGVANAVNGALMQITALLRSALGATLTGPTPGKPVQGANLASDSVNPGSLVVQPMGFSKPLIALSLVPANTKVERRLVSQAIVRPAVTSQAAASLPRTGADLPLTGAVATALLGAAAVARRRRSAKG